MSLKKRKQVIPKSTVLTHLVLGDAAVRWILLEDFQVQELAGVIFSARAWKSFL